MAKQEKMVQRKYCIVGVCQFCGKDGYYSEENRGRHDDIQRGWFGLFDVAAQALAVHGEWCSMECFWNDMLCQTTAESINDYIKRKNKLLKQLRKENRDVRNGKKGETGCPRRLPTITLKNGKIYFIDERLRQLRNVNNPFDTMDIYL